MEDLDWRFRGLGFRLYGWDIMILMPLRHRVGLGFSVWAFLIELTFRATTASPL